MRLILIRHASTDGNRHRYVGREDLPLSPDGERDAEFLAERLRSEPLDAIYSSPLTRAVRTAEPIARRHLLAVRLRSALMEIDFGSLQGTNKGAQPLSLKRKHFVTPMPGGESLVDLWQRLEPVGVELLADLEKGRHIAVVGHYWSNRILLARLQGLHVEQLLSESGYKPANASALALEFSKTGRGLGLHSSTWLQREHSSCA